ncbi:hypothetical protein H4O20_12810, partial [Aequorivita sp. 609]
YITHDRLKSRSFIKGDDAIFLLSLEDVTGLLEPQFREIEIQEFRDLRLEIENSSGSSTATVAVSVFVGAAMFLGLVASALFYVRRRRRQMGRDRDIEPERTDG